MGKVRIDGRIGAGEYVIRRQPDRAFFDRKKERLTAHKGRLSGELVISEARESDAQIAVDAARAFVLSLLGAAPETPQERADYLREVTEAQQALIRASLDYEQAHAAANRIRLQIESLRSRLAILETGEPAPTEVAWCVDYTEDLAIGDTVGSIEINDEGSALALNIVPGTSPLRSSGHIPKDGDLRPRQWQAAEQVYFNAAILPGVQRHHPQYRSAIITSIDTEENVCDLTLDVATSSASGLNINPPNRSLSAVPIVYMACDSEAFEVGDHVVVLFQTRRWGQPVVIGFVREPKPCLSEQGYLFRPIDDNSPNGWPGPENTSPRWRAYAAGDSVTLDSDVLHTGGPHFWRGNKNRIVSFDHGGLGRYGWRLFNPSPSPELARVPGQPHVYILGSRIQTGALRVVGAALFRKALVIVARTEGQPDALYCTDNPYPQLLADANTGLAPVDVTPAWNLVSVIGTHRMPWFFAPDGSEATTVQHDTSIKNERIRTIRLTGGEKDPVTDELAVEMEPSTTENWSDPFSSLAEIDWSQFETTRTHASKGSISGWGTKAGGPLSNADETGYVQGSWGHSYTWTTSGWDGSTIPEHLQGFTPPYEVYTGTVTEEMPDAFYEQREMPTAAFEDLGSAWPAKFTDYAILARNIPGDPVVAEAQVTVQRRPVYTALFQESRDFTVKWSIDGSVLLAMDYLPSGKRIPITLQPDAGTENGPEVRWTTRRISPRMAHTYASGYFDLLSYSGGPNLGEMLFDYHFGGPPPTLTDGRRVPPAARNTLTGLGPGWYAYSPTPYEERTVTSHGTFGFSIAVDGVAVPGTSIGGDGLEMDEVWTRNNWDWTIINWLPGLPPNTDRTGDDPAPIASNPWIVASYYLIDFDAVSRSVAKVGALFEMKIRTNPVYSEQIDLRVEREETGSELFIRGGPVTLPHADSGGRPSDVVWDWATYAGVDAQFWATLQMVQSLYDPIAPGLCTKWTPSQPELLGVNFEKTKNALVVRGAYSAMFSYAETNTDRRAIYAQFNGSAYDLEANIDVPTKNNLRLLNINPV